MSQQGFYRPSNPQKYKGDPRQIVYRSSWERKCMALFDHSSDIVAWSSETVVVTYRSPVDNKQHRYFLDFWIKRQDGTELIIEVKPHNQTIPPPTPKRQTSTFKKKVATYLINQSKWDAARSYARARGMQFKLLTEHDIF